MKLKITRNNLIYSMAIAALLLLMLLLDSCAITFAVVTIVIVKMMLDCFRRKNYLYLVFCALTYEVYAVMYFLIKVIALDETSWRIQYSSSSYIDEAFFIIALSLMILACIYYLAGVDNYNIQKKSSGFSLDFLRFNNYFSFIFIFACLLYLVIYIRFSGLFSARNYSSGGNSQIIALYRVIRSIYVVYFLCPNSGKSSLLKILKSLLFLAFVVLDLVVGLFGYRFILVELIFLLFFLNFEKIKRVKIRYLILVGIIFVICYVAITLIRTRGAISTTVLESFFRHERNIFYGLVAILENRIAGTDITNTYVNSLLNLLPISIGQLNQNTGQILLPYIQGRAVFQEGLTMGAFYLSEAFFCYRLPGVTFISMIGGALMAMFERKKSKYKFRLTPLIYYFVCAQMYSIVYYGSSNYIKIIVYYSIAVYLFNFAERILGRLQVK